MEVLLLFGRLLNLVYGELASMYSQGGHNPFTQKEDKHLVEYIARENPGTSKRTGNKLYERLVENRENKWPWHKTHSWMSWRERYKSNQPSLDKRIHRYQKENGIEVPDDDTVKKQRNLFTEKEDQHLIAYIARENPGIENRTGNKLYQRLERNEGKWPWSKTRSWQSWRERYKTHQEDFDIKIRHYQEKNAIGIFEGNPIKRKRENSDNDGEREEKRARTDNEGGGRNVRKRRIVKRQEEEESTPEPPKASKKNKHSTTAEVENQRRGAQDAVDIEGIAEPLRQTGASTRKKNDQAKRPKADETARSSLQPVTFRARDADQVGPVIVPKRTSEPVQPVIEDNVVEGEHDGEAKVEDKDNEEGSDEDEDEEDDLPRGPVGSDDYQGNIFAEQEDEDEDDAEVAAEVDAMLTDTGDVSDPEIEQSQIPEFGPNNQQRLYPNIETLRSPTPPTTRDPYIPGAFDTPTVAAKEEESSTLDMSQEPTPPLSGIDDIPCEVEKRPAAYKKDQIKPKQIKPSSKTSKLTENHRLDPSKVQAEGKPAKNPLEKNTSTSIPASDNVLKLPADIKAPLKPPAPSLKRKQLEPEDPFDPSPPTPNSEQESHRFRRKRQVPILEEGAFRNTFRGTRRPVYNTDTESDSDEAGETKKPAEVWPPIRRRPNDREVKPFAMPWGTADIVKENTNAVRTKGKVPTTASKPPIDSQVQTKEEDDQDIAYLPRSAVRPSAKRLGGIQVNAMASTSRNMLPPKETSARALFKVTSSKEVSELLGDSTKQRPQESEWEEELITPDDSTLIEPEVKVGSAAKRVAAVLSRNSIGTNSSISGKGLPQDVRQKASTPFGLPTSDSFQPPRPQSPLSDDPFVDSPYKKKGKGRSNGLVEGQVLNNHGSEFAGPRIDLRREVQKHQRHIHLSSVSDRTSTSTSRSLQIKPQEPHSRRTSSALSLSLPQGELHAIQERGLKVMISEIATRHGFAEGVVQNIFNISGSLKDTERVIMVMKASAEKAATEMLEQLKGAPEDNDESEVENDHDSVEDEQAMTVWSRRSEKHQKVPAQAQLSNRDSFLSTRARGKPERLQIKPLIEDDHMSDYSPPNNSRAGKYVRLADQGRVDEAVERERRRASLGYSASRLHPRVFGEAEESPARNDDSSRPRSQLQPSCSQSLAHKEPEPPKFAELTEELKDKFKNASRENIDELRLLEKTVDQGALMNWFVGCMRELAVKQEPED
ncbi:hypothetical protein BDQ17DRAFT_714035 [Cyathus striatus]|nr:hypothetical protein BDQ17DRAFT_714035 [Cyathus striatus]